MMSYLPLGIGTSMTDYQKELDRLAREKVRAYFSGTTMDWHLLTTEMESISMKYCVHFNKVDDDVSLEYKASVKRTIEYASRNNAVLFSRTETKS
jgi:hypothetical protein